jgi:hypothetical protein
VGGVVPPHYRLGGALVRGLALLMAMACLSGRPA